MGVRRLQMKIEWLRNYSKRMVNDGSMGSETCSDPMLELQRRKELGYAKNTMSVPGSLTLRDRYFPKDRGIYSQHQAVG